MLAKPKPAHGIPWGNKGASNAHQPCRSSPEHNAGKGTHPPQQSVLYAAFTSVVKNVLIETARGISRLLRKWMNQSFAFAKVHLLYESTAVLIDTETAGMMVSSNHAIVRADRQQIIPSYLHWLLNTPKVKKRIKENTTSCFEISRASNVPCHQSRRHLYLERRSIFIHADDSSLTCEIHSAWHDKGFRYSYDYLPSDGWEDIAAFSEGMAAVKKDGKWGYINTAGEYVILSLCDPARPFCRGVAIVDIGDEWFIIVQQGNILF